MSELKARHIVDVYDSYYAENPFGERSQVYLKSEADKVIAELEESHKMEVEQLLIEIVKLKAQKAQAEDDCAYWEFKAHRERHNKYKRCLAIASKCRLRARWFGDNAFYKKEKWALKWHRIWLELAEKFKETK